MFQDNARDIHDQLQDLYGIEVSADQDRIIMSDIMEHEAVNFSVSMEEKSFQ